MSVHVELGIIEFWRHVDTYSVAYVHLSNILIAGNCWIAWFRDLPPDCVICPSDISKMFLHIQYVMHIWQGAVLDITIETIGKNMN